jgi:hypothetical protein
VIKHLASGAYVAGLEPRFAGGEDALRLNREEAEHLVEVLRRLGALVAIVRVGGEL